MKKKKLFNYKESVKNKKKENDKYYSAEISYNGLELIFDNNESMYIYIKLCIFYGKVDCLYTLINKIDLEEVEKYDEQLHYLIKYDIFNSPYSHYYRQIININNKKTDGSGYLERFKRDSYPDKYIPFSSYSSTYEPTTSHPFNKMGN